MVNPPELMTLDLKKKKNQHSHTADETEYLYSYTGVLVHLHMFPTMKNIIEFSFCLRSSQYHRLRIMARAFSHGILSIIYRFIMFVFVIYVCVCSYCTDIILNYRDAHREPIVHNKLTCAPYYIDDFFSSIRLELYEYTRHRHRL